MDGVKPSAARQTSCNVRKRTQQRDTAAIVVAVAIAVTVAAADAVTATVAGGHRTPLPRACSRVRSCCTSCPLLRLPRKPRGAHAQIPAEL